jgi:WD40 repeat protein
MTVGRPFAVDTADATGAPPMVFLSHLGVDRAAARALKERIEAAPIARQRELKVFFAEDDLRAGEAWMPQLEDAICRRATVFAVYVGSTGVLNWAGNEVQLALDRATTSQGRFRFVPILAMGASEKDLPGFARLYQCVRDTGQPEQFEKLVRALLGETPGGGSLQLEAEPFFGLKAIDERRNHLFFGREGDSAALLARLRSENLLMVTGDSGSGKSSLVRAGLIPSWRGGAFAEPAKLERPSDQIWHVIELRPTGHPFRALGDAVSDAAGALARSAQDQGTYKQWLLLEQGDKETPRAVAHLTRALRSSADEWRAAERLSSVFTERSWARPLGEPLRHESHVQAASFSPDGKRVVTASNDKTARIWDALTGQPLGEPLRHEDMVLAASFSPDGKRVVTGSADRIARVWDALTGQPLGAPLRHESSVLAASFSPDGKQVVTASYDKTARVWDALTGQPLGEPLRHQDFVPTASFSPDGKRIVTVSNDKTARVWDALTGQALGEPLRHEDLVRTASFSPDGKRVVTASEDKTARVWDAFTGKPLGQPLRHEKAVVAASFSPDGKRVVTASYDKTARVWDALTGKPVGEPLHHAGSLTGASFSANGTRVVTTSYDKTARVWDALTGKPLGEPLRHEGQVLAASFSPDGERLVTVSGDKTARVWGSPTGRSR